MNKSVEMRCGCGTVHGIVRDASPRTVNRVVCYCDDCQAFAHQLGRADLLNAQSGSDIIQVAPASLTFVEGQDRIKGVRLTPKGLYRWYASCCHTPVGNTLTPSVPFVGIFASTFDHGSQRVDEVFGPPTGAVFGRYATGDTPAGSAGIKLSLMLGVLAKVLGWRLRGRVWPHPFFRRDTGAPVYPVDVLSQKEREALRAFCGPHPTATSSATSAARPLAAQNR